MCKILYKGTQRPYIALAGDCSQSAYILRPVGVNTAGRRRRLQQKAKHDEGETIAGLKPRRSMSASTHVKNASSMKTGKGEGSTSPMSSSSSSLPHTTTPPDSEHKHSKNIAYEVACAIELPGTVGSLAVSYGPLLEGERPQRLQQQPRSTLNRRSSACSSSSSSSLLPNEHDFHDNESHSSKCSTRDGQHHQQQQQQQGRRRQGVEDVTVSGKNIVHFSVAEEQEEGEEEEEEDLKRSRQRHNGDHDDGDHEDDGVGNGGLETNHCHPPRLLQLTARSSDRDISSGGDSRIADRSEDWSAVTSDDDTGGSDGGGGWANIFVPNYDGNRIYVFSMEPALL